MIYLPYVNCEIWSVCYCVSIMSAKSQISIVKIKVTKYPSLANLVKRILFVPATSAPVKRVFSHGSIIIRPHPSKIS